MSQHEHSVKVEQTVGFRHCVNSEDCNPASHGGVMVIEVCQCGATRLTNVNGCHFEEGPWQEATR